MTTARPPTPKPPPEPPPKTRVLIVGDSMAATDFGRALQQELGVAESLEVRRRGKSATGLARPDYFDWMAEGARLVRRHTPGRVLVIVGGNDGQDLIGEGRRVRWGTEAWPGAYADRWRRFLDVLLAGDPDREVVVLALPLMARPRLERKLAVIRSVQAEVAAAHPRVRYFETRGWFLEGSAPRTEVELGGKRYPLRQPDGIHFSRPGAIWLARQVAGPLKRVLRTLDSE